MAGFQRAKAEQAALKMGIYGPPGAGKTFTSLLVAEGLASSTVNSYVRILGIALEAAVKLDALARNPARAVKLPKIEKRRGPILSVEEVREFLKAAGKTRHGPMIFVAILTGKRWDELASLHWADVQLDRKAFYVRHAKRPASERAVALSGTAMTEILLQQRRVKDMRAAAGKLWVDNDLVFPSRRGAALDDSDFNRDWHKLVDVRWPGLHFHDLRHECTTLLAWAGVMPQTAQKMLGHASIEETVGTYTHVLPSDIEAAAERLDAFIAGVR